MADATATIIRQNQQADVKSMGEKNDAHTGDGLGVDAQTFKETLAHWATGVTVVTTNAQGRAVGITASSFTSLSVSPPRVLISVNKRLYTHQAIRSSGFFAVNILNEDQLEWGMRFAGMMPETDDRFAGIATFQAESGAPILPGVLAWVDCKVRERYDGVDHTIFIGEVLAAGASGEGNPLLYYNRQWRGLRATTLDLHKQG